MPLSLHAAIVPGFLQMLGSTRDLLDRAQAHCEPSGADSCAGAGAGSGAGSGGECAESDIVHGRLAPDMFDFAYQVKSAAVHSLGAIEGVRAGVFRPDTDAPPQTIAALRRRIEDTIAALEQETPEGFEALADRTVEFRFGERLIACFRGDDFLLSFAQPNLYFHVTTAYAILRHLGVKIGKRDYLGTMRMSPNMEEETSETGPAPTTSKETPAATTGPA